MTKQKTIDLQSFYDKMAPFYDRHIGETRFPFFSAAAERQFVESLLGDRNTILDLGCGTGRTMRLLQGNSRRIFGVDISGGMVRMAKTAGLNVVQASCDELPFRDASFDAAYSIHMGFGFCTNRYEMEALSRELFRVLKRRGLILLDTPHARVKGKEYLTSWMAGSEMIRATSYGKIEEEIREVLVNSGFADLWFYGFYSTDHQLSDDSRRIIVFARRS